MSLPPRDDEFFVGWLPTPAGYVRFSKSIVIALLAIASAGAAGLAFFQRDPGRGEWDDGNVVVLRGHAFTTPYAMLRAVDDRNEVRSYLLVEDGKFGALPRVSGFVQGRIEGVPVEIKGTILHRGDRWMIAIENDAASMRPLTREEANALPALGPRNRQAIASSATLRGEIIDPKCYLGAMKPGGGKTHKACAMRCIAGGIPPMLVTRDGVGHETFYLIVTESGDVANQVVFPFVGDRVEVTGQVECQDDLLVLRISTDSLRRL
jgi:hypothetical protein